MSHKTYGGWDTLESRMLLSAGDLDPTFGINGATAIHVEAGGSIGSITPLSSGKLLVAASFSQTLNFFRLNSDGSIDTSFGTGGRVTETFGSDGTEVDIDSAGHIAVGGPTGVAVFNADGSPLDTFGDHGVVTFSGIGSLSSVFVAFAPDGDLITAAREPVMDVDIYDVDRLNIDGSPDTSFGGGDGIINLPQTVTGLAVGANGHIFVATHYTTTAIDQSLVTHVVIHSLGADGATENSFDAGGGKNNSAASVTDLQSTPDGRVLALISDYDVASNSYRNFLSTFTFFGVTEGVAKHPLEVPAAWPTARIIVGAGDDIVVAGVDSQKAWYAQRYKTNGALDFFYGHTETAGADFTSVARPGIARPDGTTGDAVMLPDGSVIFANTRDRAGKPHEFVFAKVQGGPGVTIDATLNGKGTLIVNGTPSPDHILLNIRRRDGRLTVHGDHFDQSFAPSRVKRIAIFANGGDDNVGIDSRVRGAYLEGGDGDDTLTGGDNADIILGGVGDDSLTGGLSPDRIYGGDGRDNIFGGGGADYLDAGLGNDYLYGNGGNDLIFGNSGDDHLFGGGGADQLFGGTGQDSAAQDDLDTRDSIETLLT